MEERLAAHQMLFTGQANVRVIANELGCSLESLQATFAAFCSVNPLEGDEWKNDVELAWPFA